LPVAAAPEPEPEAAVPEAELDLTAGEPDLLEAAVAAEGTPVEDYVRRQRETEAQRINALPVPNS
jgi:hypothetical protein